MPYSFDCKQITQLVNNVDQLSSKKNGFYTAIILAGSLTMFTPLPTSPSFIIEQLSNIYQPIALEV